MAAQVTSADFASSVLESRVPVLVDFYADWCQPCRLQGPILDELARESQDRFQVVKINADDDPSLAQQWGVSALPTLLVFHEGRVVRRLVGLQSKDALQNALAAAV
jgi:thioredoxin 1